MSRFNSDPSIVTELSFSKDNIDTKDIFLHFSHSGIPIPEKDEEFNRPFRSLSQPVSPRSEFISIGNRSRRSSDKRPSKNTTPLVENPPLDTPHISRKKYSVGEIMEEVNQLLE